ncbi:dehydrogenase/reductase SDR family member 4-like [Lutzomyia longipalpis]|uniref:dehydrogenase/reductase SDR family member 4-like n=1 Tax=Lutzomyia longipalpis TaxID=7200 RepID=UPI0024841ED7|nr:dehydrogenase/reductase SDR family member 4-like [Lutzomyia longipalpis]
MAHNCLRFVGKVAVLTGSTNGIGLAIARRLGQEGAKVVVSSRNIENVNKAVEELRKENIEVIGVKCHVSNKEERANLLQEAIKNYNGIDLMVAAAGVSPYIGDMVECPESAFDKIFQVNVKDTFLLTNEVIPFIRKQGGGSILFISSVMAYENSPYIGLYGASKLALSSATKTFACAVIKDKIRVNCLAPGPIDTNFMSKVQKYPQYDFAMKHQIPMGRMGYPEEVGGPAAFLLSDDAGYITGETLMVGGGMQARL